MFNVTWNKIFNTFMKDALSFHLKCEVINYSKNNLFIIKEFILVIQTVVHVFFVDNIGS